MVEDLPVVVALPAPLDAEVTAWVEHDLGWQIVDPGAGLAPVLALSDQAVGPMSWVAVTDGPPSVDAVRRHLTAGAVDVLGWPDDRHRLPAVAADVTARRARQPRTAVWTVAGAAGGVGVSTTALAVGGLLAWSGAAVLVVGGPALADLSGVRPAHTDAPDRPSHAPVRAVPGLSVAVVADDGATTPWAGDVLVVDGGTRAPAAADLIVARADGALRRARAAGRPVVLVEGGPLGPREVRRVLGTDPLVTLPWSQRVARAGVLGRVPQGLPGSWLRTLRSGLAHLQAGG